MSKSTIIKFPDGRTEQKNILSHFNKNGTNVILFETDKVDNGHKVTGVSYLNDGMYQNVVDTEKWNEIKGDLVDILHDVDVNYQVAPSEVSVTQDPYRQLALRDANYDKIVESYNEFERKQIESAVQPETIQPVNNISSNELQTPEVASVQENVEQPISLENEQVITPFAPAGETTATDIPVSETITDIPVESTTVTDIPVSEPQISGTSDVQKELEPSASLESESVITPFAPAGETIVTDIPVSETLTDIPVGGTTVTDIPVVDTVVNDTASAQIITPFATSNDTVAINTPQVDEVAATVSVIDIPTNDTSVNVSESPVKSSYIGNLDQLAIKANELKTNYINQINEITDNFIKEINLVKDEVSRSLEEARGINELSKQTFDKAQALGQNNNLDNTIELTKVA